jgi:hypothetical protein
MNFGRDRHHAMVVQRVPIIGFWGVALLACLLTLAASVCAQEEPPEPPPAETHGAQTTLPDALLPQITAAIQGVATPNATALSKALHIGERLEGSAPGAPPNTLDPIGPLGQDHVAEMLLKWAIPDVAAGGDVAPAPDSRPLWGLYLLSWDGARWKASRLLTGVEDFIPITINLGPPVGRGLAIVILEGDPPIAYPAIFQVKDHAATLLWEAQADDSRYQPLLQGRVSFTDHARAPAELIVTGRADPGFLQVDRRGRRGFQGRAVYHWSGTAFIPVKTEYSANQDYTIYRFISALHLHDYASAYGLVDAAKFLKTDSPTLDVFRRSIQDNWPEFLQDELFAAPEPPVGSPDEHFFVLSKPDKRYVYHPVFSTDGKFLLTGLTRAREAPEP